MGSIPPSRWALAGIVLIVALALGYFFDRPSVTMQEAETAEETPTPSSQEETAQAKRTPVPFAVKTTDESQTAPTDSSTEDKRSEELPSEAQRVAAECLKGGYLQNPTEDTKTLSSLLTAFFNETQTTSQVANQEVTFIDTDGTQKKLKVDASGINDAGQTTMRVRMFRVSSGVEAEDAIPYELQSLDWQELMTRYLDGKRRLREKVVLSVQSPSSDRSALVEMIDGRRTELTLEFGDHSLGCAYDAFTKANRCDCQVEDAF